MITIVDINNVPFENTLHNILQRVNMRIQRSGKLISDSLKFTVQRHFQKIYPNSKHYSPNKVKDGTFTNGQNVIGSTNIQVAGITRAYKNLTIKPRFKRALTIPIHRSAYGKRATEFSDLFVVNKKNGKSFLAQKNAAGGITFMYVLAKSAFQKQDKRLMPSDETLANNIFSRINVYLNRTKI